MSYADQIIPDTGKYLKIKPGETAKIHLLSKTPKTEIIHWEDKNKTVCSGQGCNSCQRGIKAVIRYKINIWDRKSNREKEFECGPSIMGDIIETDRVLREDGKTVHDVDFRINCYKDGEFTKYKTIHTEKGPVPPVPYRDGFSPIGSTGKVETEPFDQPLNEEEVPF